MHAQHTCFASHASRCASSAGQPNPALHDLRKHVGERRRRVVADGGVGQQRPQQGTAGFVPTVFQYHVIGDAARHSA